MPFTIPYEYIKPNDPKTICANCGKEWSEHYRQFCRRRDFELGNADSVPDYRKFLAEKIVVPESELPQRSDGLVEEAWSKLLVSE